MAQDVSTRAPMLFIVGLRRDNKNGVMHAVHNGVLACGRPIDPDWPVMRGVLSARYLIEKPDACRDCARVLRMALAEQEQEQCVTNPAGECVAPVCALHDPKTTAAAEDTPEAILQDEVERHRALARAIRRPWDTEQRMLLPELEERAQFHETRAAQLDAIKAVLAADACTTCDGEGEVHTSTSVPGDDGVRACPVCEGTKKRVSDAEIVRLRALAADWPTLEAKLAQYKERLADREQQWANLLTLHNVGGMVDLNVYIGTLEREAQQLRVRQDQLDTLAERHKQLHRLQTETERKRGLLASALAMIETGIMSIMADEMYRGDSLGNQVVRMKKKAATVLAAVRNVTQS